MKDKDSCVVSRVWFLPIVIIIAVVPLVLMVHMYYSGLDGFAWFGNEHESLDCALYYKALLIELCGAVVSVLVIGLYVKRKPSFLHDRNSLAPIFLVILFTVLSILSSVLAFNTWDASFGGYGRFEGCYVILSYVVFFYMVFGYARSIEIIRFLLDALMIGAVILSLLGVIELFSGVRLLEMDWFKPFLFFVESRDINLHSTSFMVSSTLENSNYVGSYVPLVLPYCIYIVLREKRLWRRILAGIAFELLGIFLVGSESDTGLIAIAAGIIVGVFFLLPKLDLKRILVIVTTGCVVIALIILFLFSGGISENVDVVQKENNIMNIETDYNSIVLSTSSDKRIRVRLDENKAGKEGWSQKYKLSELLSVTDEDTGRRVPMQKDADDVETIHDEDYPSLSFYLDGVMIPAVLSTSGEDFMMDRLCIRDGGHYFYFGTFMGANMCFLENGRERILLNNVERCGFEGKYEFASGRGYIWACTIPLLKKYLLLGAGQDNFIYAFPNGDYIGKAYGGFRDMFISKPHNMFLGIWVQQGLIALLAFLILYALFMIRVIRLCYGKHRITSTESFSARGVAIMTAVGTSAYMVSGLANDSNVGVTPIYWVLLGVGYAAEAICRQNDDLRVSKEDAWYVDSLSESVSEYVAEE